MRRIQLHLDEELDDALAREALTRGIPKAALIREYLAGRVGGAAAAGADPSQSLIGIYEGSDKESDLVDDIVYGS